MDAGTSRVEGELADRNTHAARPLVAKAQYSLAVADHDDADSIEMRIGKDLADAVLVRKAQEQAARLAPDLAEALAALTHRRGIDQRQYLLEIAHGQGIEQCLV